MRYLLLIYNEEVDFSAVDPADAQAEIGAYNAFTDELRASGANLGGEALEPTSTATTVRVRDGQIQTTDGPFAETKEALGGYYLIEAGDLDAAIGWAAKIPGAQRGSVEIRPIWEFGAAMGQQPEAAGATAGAS
jgi:hypothetical protein